MQNPQIHIWKKKEEEEEIISKCENGWQRIADIKVMSFGKVTVNRVLNVCVCETKIKKNQRS